MSRGAQCVLNNSSASGAAEHPRSSCRCACQWRSGHCFCACKPRVLAVRHRRKESVSRGTKCVPNHLSASGAAELPRSSCRRVCQCHSRHFLCACKPRVLLLMHGHKESVFWGRRMCSKSFERVRSCRAPTEQLPSPMPVALTSWHVCSQSTFPSGHALARRVGV